MTGRTRVLSQAKKHPMLPASHYRMLSRTIFVEIITTYNMISVLRAGMWLIVFTSIAMAGHTGKKTSEITGAWVKMDGSGETGLSKMERLTIQA